MSDSRSAAFQEFAERWLWADSVRPIAVEAVAQVEKSLGLQFPGAYRDFVSRFGTPSTTMDLLHAIVEGNVPISEVAEFIAIEELAKSTALYESGGMETGFLAFASDGSGNLFLFRKADCVPGREDGRVWYFDHDFVEIDEAAASFTAWIEAFNSVQGAP